MSHPLSMFELTQPLFRQMLLNLKRILQKAQEHAQAMQLDDQEVLAWRLVPDMFDLKKQIQIATDHAKGCIARLTGQEIPRYADNEHTFAQLDTRIDKTITFIDAFAPSDFVGSESKDIELSFPWATYHFTGLTYAQRWALPNFYFHATTAYDILRQHGVALGKSDFLGAV